MLSYAVGRNTEDAHIVVVHAQLQTLAHRFDQQIMMPYR